MQKFLKLLGLALLLFVAYILFKTFTFSSSQVEVTPIATIDVPAGAVGRLSEALRLKTISHEDPANFDSTAFEAFNRLLSNNYPLVDSLLEKKIFNQYSHLYTWKGTDNSLKPIVLMGHIDVVPIASPDSWSQPPFGGVVEDGVIWGRGTIDDKFSVLGIMEAAEMLLSQGWQPKRTIYFSFGHDEEVGGKLGAVAIASYLEQQGVTAEFVLDEGYAITQKLIPGIDSDVAFIGISEKGSVTVKLSVETEGMHSSQPSKETAIDILATAVSKIKKNPMKANFSTAMNAFMDKIGPEMGFVNKMGFANRGLFKPVIINTYENASGAGNALLRTTTAPTIFNAGIKENVIPRHATAIINFRIIPGETSADVLAHIKEVVDDSRVSAVIQGFHTEPSPVSPYDNGPYNMVDKTIKEIFDNALTSPNLVIAATDSRHFTKVSPNIYRFVPYHINQDNIKTFHGVDERIPVKDYENAIRFYRQLLLNSN